MYPNKAMNIRDGSLFIGGYSVVEVVMTDRVMRRIVRDVVRGRRETNNGRSQIDVKTTHASETRNWVERRQSRMRHINIDRGNSDESGRKQSDQNAHSKRNNTAKAREGRNGNIQRGCHSANSNSSLCCVCRIDNLETNNLKTERCTNEPTNQRTNE